MPRSFFVHWADKLLIGELPEISVGFEIVPRATIKLRDVVDLGVTLNLPGAVGLSVSKMGLSLLSSIIRKSTVKRC
jgi:hypothetical protein